MDSKHPTDDWGLEEWKACAYEGRNLLLRSNEYLIKSRDTLRAQAKAIAFWRIGAVSAWVITACVLTGVFT